MQQTHHSSMMSSVVYLLAIDRLLAFLQIEPLRASPGTVDLQPPKASGKITIDKITAE